MFNPKALMLGLLAIFPFVSAMPIEEDSDSNSNSNIIEAFARSESFSFEQWADSIIADPEGSHELPTEVSTAFGNATSIEDPAESLAKRQGTVRCNTSGLIASASDAAWCVDFLARRASARCPANYGGVEEWCRRGQAHIVGVTQKQGGTSSSCGDVARAAGRIMDLCTRGGNVEGFNTAYGNGNLGLYIRRP